MSITMEDVERALYERHLVFKNEYPDEYDRCGAEGKAYCKGSVNEFMKIVRLIYGKQDHFITMDEEAEDRTNLQKWCECDLDVTPCRCIDE